MNKHQWGVVAVATLGLAWVALRAGQEGGSTLVLATLIGALGGIALYHAAFGFGGGWRRIVVEGKGAGVRHQLLLLALVVLVSFPMIGWGGYGAFVFPVGVGMAAGAFMFGMGMQLGGGCGSGTLFTVGGGSVRMVITLTAFIVGSMFGRAHAPWWSRELPAYTLPNYGAMSYLRELGVMPALLLTLAMLGVLAWGTVIHERWRTGTVEYGPRKTGRVLSGPWSMALGAVVLAVVCIGTIWLLNRPWGITSAFAIWGAKMAETVGFEIGSNPYWRISEGAIQQSLFASSISVMNFGVMLGALLAAGLAQKFAPSFRLTGREVMTAVVGGLLMGFGARLSGGCNIGAFLGGVASGSLHGWVWLVFGFAGSSLVAWWRNRDVMRLQPAG